MFSHLWYDPDWEHSAPTATLSRTLTTTSCCGLDLPRREFDQIPGDLSVIDAGWGVPRTRLRAAAESSEADWSPEVAGRSSVSPGGPARSARFTDLTGAVVSSDLESPGP